MKIRIRKRGVLSDQRIESDTKIDNMIIKQDLMHPEGTKLSIFFKGDLSSGILELQQNEAEKLADSIKSKLRMLGKVKRI